MATQAPAQGIRLELIDARLPTAGGEVFDQEMNGMRVFWEQTGVLLPIYHLASKGMSDGDIAATLNTSELKVQSCMAWLLHFLKMADRNQLAGYALLAAPHL